MKGFENLIEQYFAKPTLLDRINEAKPEAPGEIAALVKCEILKQEQAIKEHIVSRINDLERRRKKLLSDSNSRELAEKGRLMKIRRAEFIGFSIKELRFLMLSNGKLKRDSSYPRL